MNEVSIIGLDLAKNVFQAHGAGADGSVVFRRKLSRAQLLTFLSDQPPCVVAMEACASAHHWGRSIGDLGHEIRLIPPAYVKPFVKRQKNHMTDAEAIAEAASRPTMRFVAVKSEAQQAAAMAYRTRDLLVRQRTQTINALRAHLAEQGIVAPAGPAHVGRLAAILDGDDGILPAGVPQAGWATSSARDHKDGSECRAVPINALLGRQVWLAGWPTAMAGSPATDSYNAAGNTDASRRTVKLVDWSKAPAPPGPMRRTASGEIRTGSSAAMAAGGPLSPEHSRWQMGYPAAWGCCGATAMQSCRRSRRNS